jgi:hypothetical protein
MFRTGFIMTLSGKALKLSFLMLQYQVKESIKFWTLSAHRDHSQATTLTLVTVFMELMLT